MRTVARYCCETTTCPRSMRKRSCAVPADACGSNLTRGEILFRLKVGHQITESRGLVITGRLSGTFTFCQRKPYVIRICAMNTTIVTMLLPCHFCLLR